MYVRTGVERIWYQNMDLCAYAGNIDSNKEPISSA